MSKVRSLLLGTALAVGAFAAAPANATVLYDNFAYEAGVTYNIGAGGGDSPVSQSFSTGAAEALALSNVGLDLDRAVGSSTQGSFVVTLNSGLGTGGVDGPGGILATLGTFNDSVITPGGTLLNVWGQGYMLAANTRYWIEILDTNASGNKALDTAAVWNYAADASGTGAAAEFYTNNGTTYPSASSGNNPLVMTVETPEPVSLAILGVGLAGLGYARSRRKHVAAKV